MPIYVYKHPDEEEYREVFQGMNDKHVYEEGGVEWKRVFLSPNASIGKDPVKEKYYDNYAKERGGAERPNRIKEKGYESKNIKIDYD